MNDIDLDLVGGKLGERMSQRFLRALHVGFQDQRQRLGAFPVHVVEDVLQLRGLLLGQLGVAEFALPEQRDLACLALVAQHDQLVARRRNIRQALDLDRNRGAGALDGLAGLVQHGPHTAETAAGQHNVAPLQRSRLHQHGGHRSATLVEL